MTLKANAIVYRVIEDDPPPGRPGPHTWKVVSVAVVQWSERQIKLATPLPGHHGTVYKPDSALGRLFFETPLQALQHFLTAKRLEIESLERRRKDAKRAVEWVTSQAGMTP